MEPTRFSSSLEAATTGATFGVALWVLVTIIVVPVIAKGSPQWSAAGMRAAFPWLVGWILFGFVFGFAWRGLAAAVPRPQKGPEAKAPRARIVILGGGLCRDYYREGARARLCLRSGDRAYASERYERPPLYPNASRGCRKQPRAGTH